MVYVRLYITATLNVRIQMKLKELTKTFMVISNWKKPFGLHVYTQIFQPGKGWKPLLLFALIELS